ncbi:Metallo-dependent phosphatase [Marasmius fiardii PR-910]|nr:Metallo-dependent phosphatase [Marasmius fiardii PR-910]
MSTPQVYLSSPTTRIHTRYYMPLTKKKKLFDFQDLKLVDIESPPLQVDGPPHPENGWTRFVCISDTHSNVYTVPKGDVLLHAGDLSSWGEADQLKQTVDWIASLEGFQVKILVGGNHDLCLDEDWCKSHSRGSQKSQEEREYEEAMKIIASEEVMERGIRYLEHGRLEFTTNEGRKWIIYGSPAAPKYALGAFQYKNSKEAEGRPLRRLVGLLEADNPADIYKRIPDDAEILLTHTPPYRTLDKTRKEKYAGCKVLKDVLDSGRLNRLRLHVFGHIHEAHGALLTEAGRAEVNAAMAWRGQAIIVDLKN